LKDKFHSFPEVVHGVFTTTFQCWGPIGHKPILMQYLFLEGKTQFLRRTTGMKSNTCEGKPHAKEEIMQGTQVEKHNHVRVMVLIRDCNN
jgi:hypothetical protein